MDAGFFEQLFDRTLNGLQISLDLGFKFATRDGNAQVQATVLKAEFGPLALRQLELDLLHCLVKLVAEVFFHERNQSLNLIRFQRSNARTLQYFAHGVGAQKRKIVPALEVAVNPRRDSGQQFILKTAVT
jgi:hypothetical protein